MQHLNGKQLVNAVTNYISEASYPHAIMIDGEWGCGKTYFVKNQLKDAIENVPVPTGGDTGKDKQLRKYKAVILSMYGISNVKDISSQLFVSVMSSTPIGSRFQKAKKVIQPLVGAGLKIAADYLDISALSTLSNTKFNAASIVESLSNLNNYVFIFDDLERSTIPINEALGFLNSLVENNGVKVIIIANQQEIHTVSEYHNMELKYLVASLPQIEFEPPVKHYDDIFGHTRNVPSDEENEDVEKKSIDLLKKHTKILFSEDEHYKRIKEKLIGQTFHYSPEFSEIVPSLLDSLNISTDILDQTECTQIVCSVIKEANFANLRSLQSAFMLYKRVVQLYTDGLIHYDANDSVSSYNENWKQHTAEIVLASIIRSAINYAKGKERTTWQGVEEYGEFEKKPVIRFVEDYFYAGSFESEHVAFVMNFIVKQSGYNYMDANDPLAKLKHYYDSNDNDIQHQIDEFCDYFAKGYYGPDRFADILRIMLDLEYLGFAVVPVQEIYEQLQKYVNENGLSFRSSYDMFMLRFGPQFEVLQDRYREMMKGLKELDNSKQQEHIAEEINILFFMGEGWGNKLQNFYNDNQARFSDTPAKLLYYIDPNQCVECLRSSSPNDIGDFRGLLLEHYRAYGKPVEEEDTVIDAILNGLEAVEHISKMQKMQLLFLSSNLQSIKENKVD